MHHDHTLSTPRRAAITLDGRRREGLAACVGTLIGLIAAFVASPPDALSLDVWMIGAPLYGAIVGLSLAVLRNGDGDAGRRAATSTWTLGAVCASTWTVLVVVVVGT